MRCRRRRTKKRASDGIGLRGYSFMGILNLTRPSPSWLRLLLPLVNVSAKGGNKAG